MKPSLYLPLNEQPIFYRFFAVFLSFIYSFFVKLRNKLYDMQILSSTRLPGVCISVGNITVGGTGKSPFVMELARHLITASKNPAILTRGYKSSLHENEVLILLEGKVWKKNFERDLARYPDEAMMYSQRLPTTPIIVASDRVRAAQWFLKENGKATHWILDDGFQHRKLARDIDVVLLDAQTPFGNSQLLPSGSLREDLPSLKRAHFICFTRVTQDFPLAKEEAKVKQYSTAPIHKLSFDFAIRSLDKSTAFSKANEPVLVMCGIAKPENFLAQLAEKGIDVANTYIVGDHDPFDGKKMRDALSNCKSILTTEKDYWRNPSLFSNMTKPCFLAELQIHPTKTDKSSIFEVLSLI